MKIHGIEELLAAELTMGRQNNSEYLTKTQAAGAIRLAVRRACWQTAQELSGFLAAQGEGELAEALRAMTSEELADGVDVSAPVVLTQVQEVAA